MTIDEFIKLGKVLDCTLKQNESGNKILRKKLLGVKKIL